MSIPQLAEVRKSDSAPSVQAAFTLFMAERVNLDPSVTATARRSRDWLQDQINAFADRDDAFPEAFAEKSIAFGSFARRTKIRELDDVDLISCIAARGATYRDLGGSVAIFVPDGTRLAAFRHADGTTLNSRKVIEAYVRALGDVPQYSAAEIGRNGEAAVLGLRSYPWSFDIVPAFFTAPEWDDRDYYIIPDGRGGWMKTDPRIDQARITAVNVARGGNVLNIVRLIRYWNRRPTMPTAPPYLIETIVTDYYASRSDDAGHERIELPRVLEHIRNAVMGTVHDPKRIQGDINTLDWDQRRSIAERAVDDAYLGLDACTLESNDDHRGAMSLWRRILGPEFPEHE